MPRVLYSNTLKQRNNKYSSTSQTLWNAKLIKQDDKNKKKFEYLNDWIEKERKASQ